MPTDLLESDYAEPFRAWKAQPSPATAGALLGKLGPVVDGALKAFGGPQGGSPVLRGRARRMVLDALPGYDPARSGLRTYLTGRLQGLRRVSADLGDAIQTPEQVRLDRHHLYEAGERLRDELGREPDDTELADATGLSVRRIAHVRRARPEAAEGALRAPADDGGMEHFQPAVAGGADSADAWLEFVYHSLDPVDRLVLEHSTGMNGRPVLSGAELARTLGLTPSAVSQRKEKIQRRLDERDTLGVL